MNELPKCNCIKHFYREGRANYRCIKCDKDITLELVLMADIGMGTLVTHIKTDKGFVLNYEIR